jgi:hypothetical protein
MKGTNSNSNLNEIKNCYVDIPIDIYGNRRIIIKNLPDISDTKSASYSDTTVIGRSSPIKTYSQSDNRSINIQFHFFATQESDLNENIIDLRALQSATYPREGDGGAPFVPPPVCKLKCGLLLSNFGELCVILKSYSIKFPTDVTWAEIGENYFPIKFDVDTTWDVVYASSELPGQSRIFYLGA